MTDHLEPQQIGTGMGEEQMRAYNIELGEIYLFPEQEHAGLVEEMTHRYPLPAFVIEQDLRDYRPMGIWLRTYWARVLEPTASEFHEITPILARIRGGGSTDREFEWFGQRVALAISLDDHDFLKLMVKLATKPIKFKAAYLMSKAVMDYFDDHGRFPSFTELRLHVQNATGERAIKYESITEDNWNRHLKKSGWSAPES